MNLIIYSIRDHRHNIAALVMVRPKVMNIIQQLTVAENIIQSEIGSHYAILEQVQHLYSLLLLFRVFFLKLFLWFIFSRILRSPPSRCISPHSQIDTRCPLVGCLFSHSYSSFSWLAVGSATHVWVFFVLARSKTQCPMPSAPFLACMSRKVAISWWEHPHINQEERAKLQQVLLWLWNCDLEIVGPDY